MPKQSQGPRLVRRKNKPNWFIRYIDEKTGKQKDISTGTSDRHEAEEVLEDFLRERRAKRLGYAVMPHRFTVAQALDDYAHHKMGSKTAARLSYSMVHLLGYWQDQTIDFVNIETVEDYRRQGQRNGRAQGTIRRELIDLRSAVNHAANMNRMVPIKFPKLPKDSPPKKRWLNEDEFAHLLWAGGKEPRARFTLRLFLIIAFYTGARKTAIMELEWDQIDFENNTIDFNKPATEQTKKRRAFIPIPPEVRRFLYRRYLRHGHLTKWVFHQKRDPSRRVHQIEKGFRAAAKLSDLNDVTPHTLRHTRITLLLRSGERPKDVSEYVGVSEATIFKVYGHHCAKDIEEMAQRLGRTQKVRTTNSKKKKTKKKRDKNGKPKKGKNK